MKKLIKYLPMLLGLSIMNQSCTDDFEKINTPSNAVTTVNPAYFINTMQLGVVENYQRNVNLYADFYAQYWSNTVESFGSPRYEYRNDWVGNQWKEHYSGQLRKSLAIKEQFGDNALYSNINAINEIWICYWWSRMTDFYGDIPYFNAGEGEAVPYNSQEEIYDDLFKRLDQAVNNLKDNDESQAKLSKYDLIYQDDIVKWRRFANSLRIRLAMRLSNIAPDKAKIQFAAAMSSGVMQSNDDNAEVPIYSKGWNDYLHQMAWNWDNIRVSKTFTNHLYNISTVGEDPRTPIWLCYKVDGKSTTKEEAGKKTYEGLENGYSATNMPANKLSRATINLDGGYKGFSGDGEGSDNLMYVPVMFYSEVLFLQSEAVLRGWIAGNADDLYKKGIQASMDLVGVSSTKAEEYLSGIKALNGSNEAKLKQIITQKWIANFPNGVEAWADFRRTDYPDITLPVDGVSGNASVAANTWVKRIRYPDNQHNLNQTNMPASLNTVDKDRMDVKVWWDVAGTETKNNEGLMSSNF